MVRARFLLPCSLFVIVLLTTGCGNSSQGALPGPKPGEFTTVAIQLSSTANDQFLSFDMTIEDISLTNAAGKTASIFSVPIDVDFIAFNGNAAPFATVSVPQDVYTSASITLSSPRFSYLFVNDQGGLVFSTDAYGYLPVPPTVRLAKPIRVSGSSMGLTLDLQASESATLSGALPNQTYSITPVFDLTSFAIPTNGTASPNGKSIGLAAQVQTLDLAGNSIEAIPAGHPKVDGPPMKIAFGAGTEFQGIASASALSPGSLVNLDLALQPDATYAATRIEVQDAMATNIATGQIVELAPAQNYVSSTSTEQQGAILSTQPVGMGYRYVQTASTLFQTSAGFSNLTALPFAATFNSSTIVAGQKVSIGSTTISFTGGTYPFPTSITLVPQTIDAIVNSVSTSGNYQIYSVELAAYDPIVQLNSPALPSVITHLQNASFVTVYVDASVAPSTSRPVGPGGTFRFSGLLFNDSGVLRMACDRISDGVAQ